jgi:NADPH:quinone reductase-like Zn-dependent oxidoreductase
LKVLKNEPGGGDAAFDPVGDEHTKRSWEVVKKGGIVVGYGALSMFEQDRVSGSLAGITVKMLA